MRNRISQLVGLGLIFTGDLSRVYFVFTINRILIEF